MAVEDRELLAELDARFALGLKAADLDRFARREPAARRELWLAHLTTALRRLLWMQIGVYLEKPDYDEATGMPLAAALAEPGLLPLLHASARLAEQYREQFARALGLRAEGPNLAPLHGRRYGALAGELTRLLALANSPEGAASGDELDARLRDLAHFLAATLHSAVVHARTTPGGAFTAKVLFGAPLESVRSLKGLEHYQSGIFLAAPDGSATPLLPLYIPGDGAGAERLKVREFTGYRDGRLLYQDFRGGPRGQDFRAGTKPDDEAPAPVEHALHWAAIFLRLGSLHRAFVILQELPDDSRAAVSLKTAVEHALKARQARGAGQHARAVVELDLAMRARADIPYLYFAAADACVKQGDWRAAVAVYARLLEAFPACERGYMAYGDALEQRGELPRAIRAYEKALAVNPESPAALQKKQKAEARLRAGESDGAAAAASSYATPGLPGNAAAAAAPPGDGRPLAREFLQDLTALAEEGRLHGRLGGESQITQLIEILCCKERSSALVLGDPGVGKSALVEELALRMLHGQVPPRLNGRRVLMMSVATLLSGAKFRGQFEERMLALVEEIRRQDALLVIDHLHTLVSSGISRGGSLDAASLLKPALARGELQIIGLSGHEEFAAVLEKDPSLMRAMQVIRLPEPGAREARAIVRHCAPRYEQFHGVKIQPDAIREAVALAKLNVRERALPDSALQIVDRAAARTRLAGNSVVDRSAVTHTVAAIAGVAPEKVRLAAGRRLARIETILAKKVRGQQDALATVGRVLRTTRMGFKTHPRRPEGVFLFAGPTGVGKTELARAVAGALLGDENKLIRIDMSEYMERINASRLIGTAPGYVGYNDPNQLTDQVRKNPFAVILFDEIEKADASVLNLFLQIFDAGRLTDGRGRSVPFNHATLIMTSNVGTHLFAKKRMGYERGAQTVTRAAMQREIKNYFPAEFLNRLDEIVVFDPLTTEAIREIIELQLKPVRRRLKSDRKTLVLSEAATDAIARHGYSFEYGARNLSRIIRRDLLDPLAELALTPRWAGPATLSVDHDGSNLLIRLLPGENQEAAIAAAAQAEPDLVVALADHDETAETTADDSPVRER